MDIFDAIKRNSYVVLGRVGMDLFSDTGIAIEDATTFNADLGGSSANIAAGIVKLGGQASLVTRVSDDAVGRFCVGKLKHYGVGCEYVIPQGGEARNSLAVYETRVEGHQSVIYRNGAADFEMTVADVEAVDYGKFGALIAAGTVFAAEPSRSAAFRAFDLARAAGLPIIFDVDYRPYSWPSAQVAEDVLSRAGSMSDVIIGNDDEFGFMAGSKDDGLTKARQLAETSAQIVVYKMGEHGAVTFHDGTELRTGIYAVEAVKPTGAGDSFMAGFLTSIADGHDLHTALLRGSACAAIVVAKPGCAPAMPYPDDLDTFLTNHPGPTPVA
ncbi:5-dehydro-2-deoxygluconokinase [Marivivens donghaensis]|uniref:5-dehydro-2-deoxygluconokinase n=1 Tax=Marivivens donghaensis TaxID=1699413 RepID=UPI00201F8349|nr:5-dehydro-2-deoxygluconokinase [Marivivens donghaensis]MCL7410131.1 5-dehydro-2-deoxygluconokinase [Marivivens donghaensis]MDN3703405.1 5-dehydro-2-deoxygluconokinase [Marivivens donghaensis]